MAFNITQFKAEIGRHGVQRATHFELLVTPPPSLQAPEIIRNLPLRVNSVNLPSASIDTDNFKLKGYGLNEARPLGVSYDDIGLTIIADARGEIHDFFHKWMELVFPTNDENIGADNVEFFEYPVNYYGGLELSVFDMSGNKHTTFNFVNPFVTALGAPQMGWENLDSIVLIPISFKYRSYKKNSTFSGQVSTNTGTILNTAETNQ